MIEKVISVIGIGPIKFKKNKRSRAVSISIRPIKGIIVNMPFYVPYSEAVRIVELRRGWIEKHMPKIKKLEEKLTIFTEITPFNTRTRALNISGYAGEKFSAQLSPNTINLRYPECFNVLQTHVQQLIRTSLIWAIKSEAREYLPQRIKALSDKFNLKYNKLFLKNNKTNWGSCSAKNNINLNIHLIRLPDYLIDYVIVHELCHTVEKNHSYRFWELMSCYLANPKQLSKELKAYSTHIY